MPPKAGNPRKPRGKNINVAMVVSELKSGKTEKQIAAENGYATVSLRRALYKAGIHYRDLKHWQNVKADIMAMKQSMILESITDTDVKKASIRDRLTGFNILHHAERLERGQATENVNVATINRDLEVLDAEERRLKQQLEKMTGVKIDEEESEEVPMRKRKGGA